MSGQTSTAMVYKISHMYVCKTIIQIIVIIQLPSVTIHYHPSPPGGPPHLVPLPFPLATLSHPAPRPLAALNINSNGVQDFSHVCM